MSSTPSPAADPPWRGRNRAILAREAWFQAQADAMVRTIVWLATGGHAAAMRLCLRCALPVGRGRPMPIRLPALESPEKQQYAVGQIAGGLHYGLITVREALALLDAIAAKGGHIPDIAQVRKIARLEESLARAAAAIGIDHAFTISEGPVAAREAAVAAARAAGWTGEDAAQIARDYDLTPELRADAVMRRAEDG